MMRLTELLSTSRVAYYGAILLLAAAVWLFEGFLQTRSQVYGEQLEQLSELQSEQLDAFTGMNNLVTTLGTALLGAMGFLMVSGGKSRSSVRQMWAAFGSAVCVGLSLYFGYHAYQDVLFMLGNQTFDLDATQISWDRQLHFDVFLLGVVLFADFAFHELTQEGARGRKQDLSHS